MVLVSRFLQQSRRLGRVHEHSCARAGNESFNNELPQLTEGRGANHSAESGEDDASCLGRSIAVLGRQRMVHTC